MGCCVLCVVCCVLCVVCCCCCRCCRCCCCCCCCGFVVVVAVAVAVVVVVVVVVVVAVVVVVVVVVVVQMGIIIRWSTDFARVLSQFYVSEAFLTHLLVGLPKYVCFFPGRAPRNVLTRPCGRILIVRCTRCK